MITNEDVGCALGCYAWLWACENGWVVKETDDPARYEPNWEKCQHTMTEFMGLLRENPEGIDTEEIKDQTFVMLCAILDGNVEDLNHDQTEQIAEAILEHWSTSALVDLEQEVSKMAQRN